jgi:tRNA (guanine-N7-)-methyltransferase
MAASRGSRRISSASSKAPSDRDRAFFGRRKGHALKPRQARLFENLLPRLALDLSVPAPSDPRVLFDGASAVRLESGFGAGEHLAAQAQANPATGFIGIEPFINGMAKMLTTIADRGLTNIRLHHGDATEVITWLPDASLARFDLLYPDPWPKRRHWKRRFVQEASITQIARIVRPGGELRFATDWPHYAAWTLRLFARSPAFEWTAERADDWRLPWAGYTATRYEAKARREGRVPCYLIFRRR